MQDINEEMLMLYHLEALDAEDMDKVKKALEEDAEQASKYQAIISAMDSFEEQEPEVSENFEEQMWLRVDAELQQQSIYQKGNDSDGADKSMLKRFMQSIDTVLRSPAMITASLMIVVGSAYFVGRMDEAQSIKEDATAYVASLDDQARNNILLHSVAMHLENSSRLLTNVAVSDEQAGLVEESQWAKELLNSNRLFKQAAEAAGQFRIVALLEEFEPILIEMATEDADGLNSRDSLRERIQDNQLVFKARSYQQMLESQI